MPLIIALLSCWCISFVHAVDLHQHCVDMHGPSYTIVRSDSGSGYMAAESSSMPSTPMGWRVGQPAAGSLLVGLLFFA